MCDSLGDSNQAGVHFLGIGSQLRGADVPRVIKHSQPVTDCTTVAATNIPEQKTPLSSSKGKSPGDFAPFMELVGCQESGTFMQILSAMLQSWGFTKVSSLPK